MSGAVHPQHVVPSFSTTAWREGGCISVLEGPGAGQYRRAIKMNGVNQKQMMWRDNEPTSKGGPQNVTMDSSFTTAIDETSVIRKILAPLIACCA